MAVPPIASILPFCVSYFTLAKGNYRFTAARQHNFLMHNIFQGELGKLFVLILPLLYKTRANQSITCPVLSQPMP